MKRANLWVGVLVLPLLILVNSACAQFSGYFGGYYAPANWATTVGGNANFQSFAKVLSTTAPQSITIEGAVDPNQQIQEAQPPASYIDYSITLQGSGLQQVAFGYLFNGLNDGLDSAELIYYNGSGVQTSVQLNGSIGVEQTYSGQALGGNTIDFRVYSNNDNVADTLCIAAVPEPATVSLLSLGAGALLWRLRRRQQL
jgi:hypothetical protein